MTPAAKIADYLNRAAAARRMPGNPFAKHNAWSLLNFARRLRIKEEQKK